MINFEYSYFLWGLACFLHILFTVLLVVGLILFIVWAAKHLNKKSLCKLWKWLVIIGIVGMVLTSFFFIGGNRIHNGDKYYRMHDFRMMDDDDIQFMQEEMEEMMNFEE